MPRGISSDWPSLRPTKAGGLPRRDKKGGDVSREGVVDEGLGISLGFGLELVMLSKCERREETGF